MTLRTPNPWNNYQNSMDIQRIKERLSVYQLQVATGKRIVRLGDDPTGAALVVDFKSSIGQNEQLIKQADTAMSFLQASETSVESVSNNLTRLLELTEQGASDITGANGRPKIAQEVEGIRKALLGIANTQGQGKYLFAGTMTDTQPFVELPDPDPTRPSIVVYRGNGGLIPLDIGMSSTAPGAPNPLSIDTNLVGDATFFGTGGQGSASDVFQVTKDLTVALRNNDTPGIQMAYSRLKTIYGNFQDTQTSLGARQATINQVKSSLSDYNQSLASVQKSYEDVDYPSAIMNFQNELTAQQAALSAMGKTNKTNLFDYLG